jgi:hypothetical protein
MVSEPEAAAAYSLKQLNTDEVRHVRNDEKVRNEKFDKDDAFLQKKIDARVRQAE